MIKFSSLSLRWMLVSPTKGSFGVSDTVNDWAVAEVEGRLRRDDGAGVAESLDPSSDLRGFCARGWSSI